MSPKTPASDIVYLDKFTARKVATTGTAPLADVPDSLEAWIVRYLNLAVRGVRSPAVTEKIALHLARFLAYFVEAYGHDRISTCLRRDVAAWPRALQEQRLVPATINNHLASLSTFTTWVSGQASPSSGDGMGTIP